MNYFMRFLLIVMIYTFLCKSAFPLSYNVAFLNEACVQLKPNHTYITCEDIHIQLAGSSLIIKSGFKTDLASIPRIFWPILSPDDTLLIQPAILHDYLYHNVSLLTRYQCDLIFYDALRSNGVSLWKSWTIYYSVRLFGAYYFHNGVLHG